jgi:hypothetical protein
MSNKKKFTRAIRKNQNVHYQTQKHQRYIYSVELGTEGVLTDV